MPQLQTITYFRIPFFACSSENLMTMPRRLCRSLSRPQLDYPTIHVPSRVSDIIPVPPLPPPKRPPPPPDRTTPPQVRQPPHPPIRTQSPSPPPPPIASSLLEMGFLLHHIKQALTETGMCRSRHYIESY